MADRPVIRGQINQLHQRKTHHLGLAAGASALFATGALAGFAANHADAFAEEPGLFLGVLAYVAAAVLTFTASRYAVLSCNDFHPREGILELDDKSLIKVRFLPSTVMADHYIAHVRSFGKLVPVDMPAIRPVTFRRLNALSRHDVLVIGQHVLAAADIVNNSLHLGWNDF